MINKIRNDKNSSIKLKKQLMNITNNINSVRKRNNKSPDIRIKENKYISEELSTYKCSTTHIEQLNQQCTQWIRPIFQV